MADEQEQEGCSLDDELDVALGVAKADHPRLVELVTALREDHMTAWAIVEMLQDKILADTAKAEQAVRSIIAPNAGKLIVPGS